MNIKATSLAKIENFINDSSYTELIDHSASFNARLSHERRLRLPFLDPQTGVAQKHSNLHFKSSQRLPGLRLGQIYTYPSSRWRCSKRSFMKYSSHPFYRFRAADNCTTTTNGLLLPSTLAVTSSATTVPTAPTTTSAILSENGDTSEQVFPSEESNSMAGDTDSKDSQIIKDDSTMMMSSKDWYYDDIIDTNDVGSEEQGDSDFEFSLNGYKKKKRAPAVRKTTSRKPKGESDGIKKSRSSNGRGGGSTSSRSRKSTGAAKSSSSSASKSKSNSKSSDKKKIVEPPSFDSVQSDFMDGSGDGFGAYRSF